MSEEQVPPPPESPPPASPPPPPPPASPPPAVAASPQPTGDPSTRMVMIALSYMGPLALIPFLVEKDNSEIQWHAKHGLVLFGAELVGIFLPLQIITYMLPNCLGCALSLGMLAVSLMILIFHIVCIVQGIGGKRVKIPMLSDYADSF